MYVTRFRLRTLMLMLSVGGIVLTSVLFLCALVFFQKTSIEESIQQSNNAYALKLAETIDRYLGIAKQKLANSASIISSLDDKHLLQAAVSKIHTEFPSFNSVLIVNAQGQVEATSTRTVNLQRSVLTTEATEYASGRKKYGISEPLFTTANNVAVLVSKPLFSESGHYLGYIGGTLDLKKQSMLNEMLGQHYYLDQTDVSVITADGIIVYNHNSASVGLGLNVAFSSDENTRLATKFATNSDSQPGRKKLVLINLKQADWKILITGTSERAADILRKTIVNVLWFTLAIIFIVAVIISYFSAIISKPLEKLVQLTLTEDSEDALQQLSRFHPWYQEIECLREAMSHQLCNMVQQVNVLSQQAITDPLTGLYNRKGFNIYTHRFVLNGDHCIIALDIDHFKAINDQFGHPAGDAVLVELSQRLRQMLRQNDILSRFGGEEFVIFLPHVNLDEGAAIAERIRHAVSHEPFSDGIPVTLSAGVASLPYSKGDLSLCLCHADRALYKAKDAGRNQVCIRQKNNYQLLNYLQHYPWY